MLLASLTSQVGSHGVYAVFVLMVIAAVIPVGSELVMIYAGAIASGALATTHVSLFGARISSHAWIYVTLALTGVVGNSLGAIGGWALGRYGGRPFVERNRRLLHVSDAKLDRAERWSDGSGAPAVALGFALPIVRSFVAIPAGIVRMELPRLAAAAIAGCLPFCFGLAAGGWALGRSYSHLHHAFRYVEAAVVVAVLVALAAWLVRRRRSSTLSRRADDPAR